MPEKVILLPNYEQALAYRKALASNSTESCFGVDVTTPLSWLEDAWDRFGDERRIVTSLDRAFAVNQVLEWQDASSDEDVFSVTPGVISFLCRFMHDVSGSEELERALRALEIDTESDAFLYSLSTRERAVLRLVPVYRALLEERGLIEPGDALASLATQALPFDFSFVGAFEMPPYFMRFFTAQGCSFDTDPVSISALSEGVLPRMLLGAGPSAQAALLFRALRESFTAQSHDASYRVLLISHKPSALFGKLAPALADMGANTTLFDQRLFSRTDFGIAYSALRVFLLDDHHDRAALRDYFNSSFSGVDPYRVSQVDSAIRGDRLLPFEELVAMSRLLSPYFDTFEELLRDSDASILLDYLEEAVADIPHKDAAYRSEQVSAIRALRHVYEAARTWHIDPSALDFALEGLSVDVSRTVYGDVGAAQEDGSLSDRTACVSAEVWTTNPDGAMRFEAGFFDEVIVCDLDSRFYSLGERHDALTTLEEKIGVLYPCSRLNTQRLWFEHVKSLPTIRFTCERVLNAGGDEDVYPSFLWDEFIEAYRQPNEELDEFGLPSALRRVLMTQGEEHYTENLSLGAAAHDAIALEPIFDRGVTQPFASLLYLTRKQVLADPAATFDENPLVLSPSAIELYVNCPYRWFVTQRLRPDAPDETMGPLEQGTFVHSVFDAFYRRLPECLGAARLSEANLEEGQDLFSRVFDEELAKQADLQTTRYAPISAVERADARKLKQMLLSNLSVQSRMLPGFAPMYHEFEIHATDGVEYAGVYIRGRVDRIDSSDRTGQFVVLDYKGGVAGHDAGFDPDKVSKLKDRDIDNADPGLVASHALPLIGGAAYQLPHKIQTLIYAQALRKLFSAYPVGALYMSYRAQEGRSLLAGSYDSALLDLAGFAKKTSAVGLNFEVFLDGVEAAVARRIDEMKQGSIEQRPLDQRSCQYCPVTSCPRRIS